MEEKKTSIFANGLIWFGAAVSIAEILTGTFLAPLGFKTAYSLYCSDTSSAAYHCSSRDLSAREKK